MCNVEHMKRVESGPSEKCHFHHVLLSLQKSSTNSYFLVNSKHNYEWAFRVFKSSRCATFGILFHLKSLHLSLIIFFSFSNVIIFLEENFIISFSSFNCSVNCKFHGCHNLLHQPKKKEKFYPELIRRTINTTRKDVRLKRYTPRLTLHYFASPRLKWWYHKKSEACLLLVKSVSINTCAIWITEEAKRTGTLTLVH